MKNSSMKKNLISLSFLRVILKRVIMQLQVELVDGGLKFNPNYRTLEERKNITEKASINSTIMWQKRRNKNA
jgi:hypothetical protein